MPALALAAACARDFSLPARSAPAVRSIDPFAAYTDQLVFIVGDGFEGPGKSAPEVFFGRTQARIRSFGDSWIWVDVPLLAEEGPVVVRHGGGEGRSPQPFRYLGAGQALLGQRAGTFRLPSRFTRIAFGRNGTMATVRADQSGNAADLYETRSEILFAQDYAYDRAGRGLHLRNPIQDDEKLRLLEANSEGTYTVRNALVFAGRTGRIASATAADAACIAMVQPAGLIAVDLAGPAASPLVPLPEAPADVAISPDGSTCYASLPSAHRIVRAAGGALTDQALLDRPPSGLAITPDGSFLLAVDAEGQLVHRLDLVGGPSTVLRLPGRPRAVTVHPQGSQAFVSLPGEGLVARLDVEPFRLVDAFSAAAEPTALAVTPAGDALVVADDASGTLHWIDPQTGVDFRTSTEVGPVPREIAADRQTGLFYLSAALLVPLLAFDPNVGAFRPELSPVRCSGGKALSAGGGWVVAFAESFALCVARPGAWPTDRIAYLPVQQRVTSTAVAPASGVIYAALPWEDRVLAVPLSAFDGYQGGALPEAAWNKSLPSTFNFPEELALSADEKLLMVLEQRPPAIAVVDLPAGTIQRRVPLPSLGERLAMAPSGREAFVQRYMGFNQAQGLWRVGSGETAEQLRYGYLSSGRIFAMSLSPNGRLLYLAGKTGVASEPGFLMATYASSGGIAWSMKLESEPVALDSDVTGELLAVTVQTGAGGAVVLVR